MFLAVAASNYNKDDSIIIIIVVTIIIGIIIKQKLYAYIVLKLSFHSMKYFRPTVHI